MDNTSDHLYRINVDNRDKVIEILKQKGISTGIHYNPLHFQPLYKQEVFLPKSEEDGRTTLSIPYNEDLSNFEISTIIDAIRNEL